MMWYSGRTSRLLFSISSDLAITNVSRNCLVFQRLDSMSGSLIDLCLPTADTIVHNARFFV